MTGEIGAAMNEPIEPKICTQAKQPPGSQPLYPKSGLHPEMATDQADAPLSAGIPNTPEELIAMQKNKPERPEKPERHQNTKVKQLLELIEKLDITAAEEQ